MKYLLSIALILVASVTFMYYLLNNPNFLPLNKLGEYNWINIFTLISLTSLITFSLLNFVIYGVLSLSKKREEDKERFSQREKIVKSFKFSLILTTGLLTVFVLNFFNILNWMWGISILIVVLIFIFII